MATEIVFETHSTTVDNEEGRATGWAPGELSDLGRGQAEEMGARRRADGIAAVFTSDLARAVQTVSIAFAGTSVPVLHDWRLRECDYGQRTLMPVSELHATRREHLDVPYPGGESWRQAVTRVGRFLADVPSRWGGLRILVVGHVATRWGLDHFVNGVRLEDLADQDFAWQPGWEYRPWTVRRAAPTDAEFLADMLVEAANWSPEWKRQTRKRVLTDPKTAHYILGWPDEGDLGVVAESGAEPVGAAWIRFLPVTDPGYGFVAPDIPELTIGVAAGWRGRGVGRALLRAIAEQALAAGITRISLSVERKNFAHKLYLAEGYQVVDTGPQSDTMLKDLRPAP